MSSGWVKTYPDVILKVVCLLLQGLHPQACVSLLNLKFHSFPLSRHTFHPPPGLSSLAPLAHPTPWSASLDNSSSSSFHYQESSPAETAAMFKIHS